jgi:hypothetical protein
MNTLLMMLSFICFYINPKTKVSWSVLITRVQGFVLFTSCIQESVREAAVPLLGTPPIFASSSPALFTNFSIPKSAPWALVAIKDHDASIPSSTFHGKSSSSKSADLHLRTWLLTHQLPTSLELTQDTFQRVMNAPQAPLVVIAAVGEGPLKEKVEERLRDVGKKWRVRTEGSGIVNGREVVWALMDKTRWGQWLKSMYGIQKDLVEGGFEDVMVIVTDHSVSFICGGLLWMKLMSMSCRNLFITIRIEQAVRLKSCPPQDFSPLSKTLP